MLSYVSPPAHMTARFVSTCSVSLLTQLQKLLAQLLTDPGSCCSWKPAAVLLAASTIFFSAVSFTAEPLLACVVAGLMTTNRK